MNLIFLIVLIIVCVALGFIVLIQNPKGGGLAGNVAGFSTQFMGVKQTNDVLDKGTWITAALVGLLCLFSSIIISSPSSKIDSRSKDISVPANSQQAPANSTPLNIGGGNNPATPDSNN